VARDCRRTLEGSGQANGGTSEPDADITRSVGAWPICRDLRRGYCFSVSRRDEVVAHAIGPAHGTLARIKTEVKACIIAGYRKASGDPSGPEVRRRPARVSKPLLADPKRTTEAATFHKAVFARFGGNCALCGGRGATDAAHVIKRSHLGSLRFADPRLARPAHRTCHEKQERGEIEFSLPIRQDAVRAHNGLAKVPLQVPEV